MEIINLSNKYYNYKMMLCDDGTLRHISFLPTGDTRKLEPDEVNKRYWPYAFESMVNINYEALQVPHGKKRNYTLCSKRAVYKDRKQLPIKNGIDYIFTLEDIEGGVLLHLHYEVYDNSPAIVRYTEVENVSERKVEVDHIASFNLGNFPYFDDDDTSTFIHTFRSSWCYEGNHCINSLGELEVYSKCSRTGYTIESTGTWVCQDYIPFFIIEQRNANLFTAIQIECSTSWRFEFGIGEAGFDNWFYVQGGLGNDLHAHICADLSKSEKVISPKVSIAVTDEDYHKVLNAMRLHQSEVLINRSNGDKELPVIYNDWLCLMGHNDEQSIIKQLDTVEAMGVDVFVTDAGWFCPPNMDIPGNSFWEMTGHWEYNKERFPNGIKYITDAIREHNMRAGIWCEIECLGIGSALYEQHDMLLCRNGVPVTDNNHRFLNFTSPKVIDYANKIFDRFVEWGFDYVKIDYNSDSVPGATNCGSDSVGYGLYLNRIAYYNWLKELRNRHPNLIVESCSSGGMRLDYHSLSNADLASITDQSRFQMLGLIAYNVTKVIHPSQCGIWAYTDKTENDDEFTFAIISAMMGRMHLSGDFSELSNERREILKNAVSFYKNYRHILSDCYVYHNSGLLYCYKPNEKIICLELRSRDNDERVYFVQRTACKQDKFHMQVLDIEDGNYKLLIFPENNTQIISSEELKQGIDVELKDYFTAKVFHIKKV